MTAFYPVKQDPPPPPPLPPESPRVGDWIQTYTGGQFWPLDPREDEVKVEDIAHHLSMLCRYTGAVREFYSVAQHSVLVSWIVKERHAREALCHDFSEAYLVDLPRPIKRKGDLGKHYLEVEAKIEKIIKNKLGLDDRLPPQVEEADKVTILYAERRDLMAKPPQAWVEQGDPWPGKVRSWSPRKAKRLLLARFREIHTYEGVQGWPSSWGVPHRGLLGRAWDWIELRFERWRFGA